MTTPLLGQFLVAINGFVQVGNAKQLGDYLALEPPFNQQYYGMIEELRAHHRKGQEQGLEDKCRQYLKDAVDDWSNFVRYMVQYLVYLRDISQEQSEYLATYERLLELQSKANSALSQGSSGVLLLQTVITNARLLCRLAIGLDKQPQLIAHLRSAGSGGESGQRETLPERAANTVRSAFVNCLNDRTEMVAGQPKGKQPGIYVLANLCLKILFQCRKTRNATQIFENISNAAPPLDAYPRSQRVTYLYYLGRFLFQNSHYHRAQLVLQAAYNECPTSRMVVKQRRLILVYLTATNIVLGRFPSDELLSRPEADDFREHFLPLCYAIRQGNLRAFEQYFSYQSPHLDWLMHYRILFQLQNRCQPLVWRSLLRKVFQLYGDRPGPGSRLSATLDLDKAIDAFIVSQPEADQYIDPDLAGAEQDLSTDLQAFDIYAMESKLSSLINHGLVSGYVVHKRQKLAILGASKTGDHVKAGFPSVWSVLSRKQGDVVPGWKTQSNATSATPFAGAGSGMVYNLSNARPVGAIG